MEIFTKIMIYVDFCKRKRAFSQVKQFWSGVPFLLLISKTLSVEFMERVIVLLNYGVLVWMLWKHCHIVYTCDLFIVIMWMRSRLNACERLNELECLGERVSHEISEFVMIESNGPTVFCRNHSGRWCIHPNSKVHGANMGPTWGRQDPGGPHLGHVNLAISVNLTTK